MTLQKAYLVLQLRHQKQASPIDRHDLGSLRSRSRIQKNLVPILDGLDGLEEDH